MTSPSRWRRSALATLAVGAAVGFAPAPAGAVSLPCFGSCFSVSGKKGPYVPTVEAAKLAEARKLQVGASATGKGVGEHALNKGEYAGYGLSMPETEKALQGLLQEIHQAAETFENLKPLPQHIRLHIVATTFYAPTAQPDGSIIIPLGMLKRAKSKDEVTWLLGHEYSHLALAHFANDAAQERRKQFIDTVVDAVTISLEASRLRTQNASAGVHLYMVRDPAEAKRVKTIEGYQQNLRLMVKLYGQAFSRDQEDRADAAGIDFANAAKGDGDDGSHDALAQIAEDDARAAKAMQSLGDKLKDVAVGSVTSKTVDAVRNGDFSGAVSGAVSNFGRNAEAVLMQQAVQALSASHRPTAQRQVGVHAYVVALPDKTDRDPDRSWIAAVKATTEYQVAEAAVIAHDTAENLLNADKPDEALAALGPAEGGKYANAPFIANMAAKIYTAMGNVSLADQLYERAEAPLAGARAPVAASRSKATPPAGRRRGPAPAPQRVATPAPPPPPLVEDDPFMRQSLEGYLEHVSLLTAHGSYPKAKLKIAEAERRFGDHEPFLPDLIFMALKGGKEEEMQAYLDECRKVQDDGLWERCRIAILDESHKAQLEKLSPEQRAKLDRSLERQHNEGGRTLMWKKLLDGFNKAQTGGN
ncbi:M48 family metalloprotease [Phenylobacterium sp.]|uniref:M48 family metalloprotease n=1 Tax=Phenylobacterium sp. TaxID=1871053 RepID=UPI00374C8A70